MGKRMFVDLRGGIVSSTLFLTQVYEPEETRLVVRLLKQGDVFVDLGANIGYFDLIASGAVGSTGKVFAFEPDPTNLRLLRRNVEVNGCANVFVEPKAVTDTNRSVTLYLSSVNHGDHRIFASSDDSESNEGRPRSSLPVDAVALDSYFPPGSRVDLIKMDVQGAEYFALQGMKRLLRENRHVVLMLEFWPHGLRETGVAPLAFLQELLDLGFVPHRLIEDELSPVSPSEALPSTEGAYLNLVFLRNHQQLLQAAQG
jgi:FkbM family methyltransferase